MPEPSAKQDLITRTHPNRWKPGQSGNPHGRKKKADCLISVLKDELAQKIPGKDETWEQVIARAWLFACAKGNIQAIALLADRLYGKVTQPISGADGGPLQTHVTISVVSDSAKKLTEQVLAGCNTTAVEGKANGT